MKKSQYIVEILKKKLILNKSKCILKNQLQNNKIPLPSHSWNRERPNGFEWIKSIGVKVINSLLSKDNVGYIPSWHDKTI